MPGEEAVVTVPGVGMRSGIGSTLAELEQAKVCVSPAEETVTEAVLLGGEGVAYFLETLTFDPERLSATRGPPLQEYT